MLINHARECASRELNMKLSYPLIAALIAILIAPVTVAENSLEPIIVTATRTAQTVDESLAPVTLISADEIRSSGASDLIDLLSGYPGIYFSKSGGPGKSQSIYMRGANSDGVLILINGIKVGSATNGQPSLAHYPLQQIERIEVVRGPRSALYGSGAIGGVIQIFTRQPTKAPQVSASIGYGTHDTRKATLSTSGSTDLYSYQFSLAHSKTDGISAKKNQTGASTDDDGYENNSFSASLSLPMSDHMNASLNWLHADGYNEYDGWSSATGTHDDTLQQVVGVKLEHLLSDNWDYTIHAGYTEDLSDNYSSSTASKTTYNTRRESLSWQNNLYPNDGDLFTFGADYVNDKVSSTTNYGTTDRDEKALFGQYQFSHDSSDWIIALRHLDNESFGPHNTGNIDFGHNIDDEIRLTAAYGEAFHAPDMNDLYYPLDSWGYQGNANLLPEESKSFEMGIRGGGDLYQWSLQAYHTKVTNLIVWGTSPSNVGKSRMKGVEAELNTMISGWNMDYSLSWLDAVDSDSNKWLPRRSKWSYRINADREFGPYTTGVAIHGQSHSFDNASNTDRLAGFSVMDARINYKIDSSTTLNATINNLFDKEYSTAKGYNSPDRNLMLTVNHVF